MTPTGEAGDFPPPSGPEVFRPRHRLTHREQFRTIYERGLKKPTGPLVVFAMPNELGHPRLGLSVGRRVGGATQRNAIKRRLREAFRFLAARWPEGRPGLDFVIVVRPHECRKPAAYAELLESAIARFARHLAKRDEP